MTDRDRSRFAKALKTAADVYAEQVSDERAEAYFALLKGLSVEEVETRLARHMQSSQFFPKPADILGVQSTLLQVKGRALLAWTLFLEKLDGWDSVRFEDRRIHACVEGLGGWTHLADTVNGMSDFDFGVLKRDFETLYVSLPDESVAAAPEILCGNHDANNGSNPKFAKFTPAPKQITCKYLSDAEVEKLESQMKALQASRGPKEIGK